MRILVLDDAATMRRLITFHLARAGERDVVECASVAEAIAAATHRPVDLALVDYHLDNDPATSGLAFIATIRKRRDPMRIVVVSGEDDESARALAHRCGADAFVSKGSIATSLPTIVRHLGPQRLAN